jgi:hypothetical protein
MSRSLEPLPPSPFVEGTTYYGNGRDPRLRSPLYLVNEVDKRNVQNPTQDEHTPRIVRINEIAKFALNNIPPETNPEKEAEEEHLKRLFAFPEVIEFRAGTTVHDKVRKRNEFDEKSLKDALNAYIATGKDIKSIVDKYGDKGRPIMNRDVARVLRTNNELRLELGKYLLDKLNQSDAHCYLQERHRKNNSDIKKPIVLGYDEPMTSKEYSVLLALSMLDGTYIDVPSDQIETSEDDDGEVIYGQHRYVAFKLLGLDNRVYRSIKKR